MSCCLVVYKMYKEISPEDFIHKYKLIPKPSRKFLLNTCQDYDHYEKMYGLFWLDIVYDIYDSLLLYEAINDEDYDYLKDLLLSIYPIKSGVYNEIMHDLMDAFREMSVDINKDTIFKFNFNNVIKTINNEVAYRPGNYGYEKVFESFKSKFICY